MRTEIVTKVAGGALAAAMLLGGASLAFAQTSTASYNPNAQVVPSTPISGSATAVSTGTTNTGGTATVVPTTSAAATAATPGVPNTGAGGDMAGTLAIMGASAAVALMGGAYLMRRRFAM